MVAAWVCLAILFVTSLLGWLKGMRELRKAHIDAAQKLVDTLEQQLAFKTNQVQRLDAHVTEQVFELQNRIAALESRSALRQ